MDNPGPSTKSLNFINFLKKKDDKSSVWFYFLREEKGQHAQCKECKTTFKTCGSTSTLHGHLKIKHKIIFIIRNLFIFFQ